MFKFFATDRWYKEAAKQEEGHDISAGQDFTLSPEAQASVDLPGTLDTGSTYKVPITTIVNITKHDKSDFLEFAWVYGFQVIVKKDFYKVGDQVVYVPIDSLLPQWLEDRLFPADAKIKLNNHRVRQIKIRGYASQGMLIAPIDVVDKTGTKVKAEQDLAAILGITKYEPPQPGFAQTPGLGRNRNKKHEHPLFHKYNGLDNIKWFPDLFKEDEEVVVQEKLHGTNARASVLPYMANTFKKKLIKFFGFAPKIEKCYGSNNVDISAATNFTGFYGEDIYGKCFDSIDVFSKIQLGEIFFGEIVGPGIQKGYDYGLKEHKFVVFDMKRLQPDGKFEWLAPCDVEAICKERGFDYVPVLYRGKYNRDLVYGMTKGKSVFDPNTKVREGVVIKSANGYCVGGNKKALKWVSEDYLADDKNTDFH
jgi:RNA ligase (TIGR02306 family)